MKADINWWVAQISVRWIAQIAWGVTSVLKAICREDFEETWLYYLPVTEEELLVFTNCQLKLQALFSSKQIIIKYGLWN